MYKWFLYGWIINIQMHIRWLRFHHKNKNCVRSIDVPPKQIENIHDEYKIYTFCLKDNKEKKLIYESYIIDKYELSIIKVNEKINIEAVKKWIEEYAPHRTYVHVTKRIHVGCDYTGPNDYKVIFIHLPGRYEVRIADHSYGREPHATQLVENN